MNHPEFDRIHELCSLIAVEQDRAEFIALVEELKRILDAQGERLQSDARNQRKE